MSAARLWHALRRAAGPPEVWRAAAPVALVVTLLVAAAFGVALVTAFVSSRHVLRDSIDADLRLQLQAFQQNRYRLTLELDQPPPVDPGGRHILSGRLGWVVGPGGDVVGTFGGPPDLPAADRHLAAPASVELGDGYRYRLAGAAVGDRWVIVGRSIEGLDLEQPLPALPPVQYALPVLAGVFVVSLLIGRWAAQPIERARRQQLAFAANASHELRTPLAVLEGEVSLALTRERGADDYRATLERVSEEALHLRRLVDDLLWLVRAESGPRRPRPERVDLGEAARRSVERFGALAEGRGLRLRLVEAGEPAVSAPPEWIDRLLGVLLDNACKYTPGGGEVCVTVAAGGGRAELFVDDSGPGIPPEQRGRVFERFHRATPDGDGAGLGLAIAATVVSRTRGEWTVATSPLGGARVGVSWP